MKKKNQAEITATLVSLLGIIVAFVYGAGANIVASWYTDPLQMDFWTVATISMVTVFAAALIYMLITVIPTWGRVVSIGPKTDRIHPWQVLIDGCKSLLILIILIILILAGIFLFGAASVFGWQRVMTFVMSVAQLQ